MRLKRRCLDRKMDITEFPFIKSFVRHIVKKNFTFTHEGNLYLLNYKK